MFEASVSESNTSDIDEEEFEPKLKYIRLSNDLKNILLKSSATCIAVHPKFICLGSHWGVVHLLDHQGNCIQDAKKQEDFKLKPHTVAVNQISVDANGEYIATCSDDGKIFVHSLFSKENSLEISIGRLVKTVALDPLYGKYGSNKRFIIGDQKLTLYERTFLGGSKSTVLSESEGFVSSLCWEKNFVAWASNIGVRVYDINGKCSLGLIKWEENPGIALEKFRCNLRWTDSRTLLIGWVDTVRVCIVRKRSSIELTNKNLPEYIVDPVSTFQTEFYISGIAPLDHQLVLLGCSKELDESQKAVRPQLYIIEYRDNDYIDICTDSLSLRGYPEYGVNDYHLEVLLEENRFFIVAPKDVVIASPYDVDDRIQWFVQHKKFERALEIIMENDGANIRRYTIQSVGIHYLDYLMYHKLYDRAGKLCLKIFGKNSSLWEDQIYKFAAVRQLRSVSPYIPRTLETRLSPHIYEMILNEYLNLDAKGFLGLVKEWNHDLYNISAVIIAVLDHLLISDRDSDTYLEALAVLYSYEKRYDKSLSMYLKLKHEDVFTLIQKHNLYNVIQDMLPELMELDYKKTIALLLEKSSIPISNIVNKLNNNPLQLYRFLDEYDKKNPKNEFHRELLKLYATFAREKLLPFLKKSDYYPIQEALDICQREKYFPEMVYLLGVIGDTKEALELIINELKDMQHAITFCREHDDQELWNDLVNHSLNNPDYIIFLLQCIGTYINPTILVNKIKKGQEILGLKNSLVKMLSQYKLQVSVQESCNKILVSDYFNLQHRLVKTQQRGIFVSQEYACGGCRKKIIEKDNTPVSAVIIFNCKHTFHEQCLPDYITSCGICYPTKKLF